MYMLDFTKQNKKYFEMRLMSGELIHVKPPTLNMINDMQTMNLDNLNITEIQKILSRIISANKEQITVKPETIGEYDIDDILAMATGIMEFVTEIKNEKN